MKQGMFSITVNRRLTQNVCEMILAGDTSACQRPGQFLNIKLDGLFLRRPISVCDYDDEEIKIIYKIVGKGTRAMAEMRQGQTLDVLTGLGNGYDSSKAAREKAERTLSYATITSPIDGVVISRDVEAGQTVASGFETPTLFTIAADLTQMQVVADVDEADIGGVVEGQRASFTVDAYPNDVFEGVVTQIRLGDASSTSSTSTTTTVVTYEVVISAPNPDLKLKPRLTANVTIYILDKKDVLSVPNKALRFTPEKPLIGNNDIVKDCEGEHKLWTREGTTFTAHPVEVGISNGISTEIISGISEGTKVVTEATIGAMPGENVAAEGNQESGGERSPFMPGPPGSKKKK